MNLKKDHAHWYVQDLEESISFFKHIGFEFLEYTEHGGKACMMQSSDGWMLEVQEVGMIQNPGLNHLAFTVILGFMPWVVTFALLRKYGKETLTGSA